MACDKKLLLNNGELMPALGIGTWMAPDAEIEEAMNAALEAGYRHIDAAPVYGNEQAIGRVLKQWMDSGRITRDELFITSKLPPPGNRANCVEKFLRSTLEDLQITYIDMYLIHTPFAVPEVCGPDFQKHPNGDVVLDLDTDHVATWKAMEEMVTLGLARSIGISNFNKQQIERLLSNCVIKPSNLQIEMHIYFQQNELVKFCAEKHVTITAYAPLGSKGIAAINEMSGIERDLPDLLENKVVIAIGNKYDKTAAQVMLRWLIQRNVAAIPKSTNANRLSENMNIFDFDLTKEDMRALGELDAGIRVCDFGFFQGIDKHPEFPW